MEAHEAYKASRWLEAAQKYEAAIKGDPTLRGAHFFLANSYDNLYKPSRQAGEPENDAYMQKAIEWYKKAAEKEPNRHLSQARACSIWWRPTGRKSSTTRPRPSRSSSA